MDAEQAPFGKTPWGGHGDLSRSDERERGVIRGSVESNLRADAVRFVCGALFFPCFVCTATQRAVMSGSGCMRIVRGMRRI